MTMSEPMGEVGGFQSSYAYTKDAGVTLSNMSPISYAEQNQKSGQH